MIKKCPQCKKNYLNAELAFHKRSSLPDGLASVCKQCKKKMDGLCARRRRDRRRYAKDKKKVLARLASRKAYKHKIKKLKCAAITCEEQAVDLHHVDYKEPLAIVPLCKKHHLGLHEGL